MSTYIIETGKENQILRNISARCTYKGSKLTKLIKDMIETMMKSNGMGLAAPQIGINQRIIIVTLGSSTNRERIMPMINPEVISQSEYCEIEEEGCLSLPGIYEPVKRSSEIRIKFNDINFKEQSIALRGIDARVVLHEVDHLDGILFTDKSTKSSIVSTKNHLLDL